MRNEEIITKDIKRKKSIVKVSIIAIITNILLAVAKALVGIASNSIAVILDAVNHLSDALSSVVTIIGIKLAAKQPDKKHPLGYGRMEYISSMVVAALVLYVGITSAVESVKKIINPVSTNYTTIALITIAVSVVFKLILGIYIRNQGKKLNSTALIASGVDSLYDSILSLSVLASAIIDTIWGISLEAYVGTLISIFIIRSGLKMMSATISDIIGERADPGIINKIYDLLTEEDEVREAYDLFLFNYGPNTNYASVHLELPDMMTVEDVDILTEKLQYKVYKETGVILTGVGVYAYNTGNDLVSKIENDIQEIILSHDWALQVHGFNADIDNKIIRFDTVIILDMDKKEAIKIIKDEIKEIYPDYSVEIVSDPDIGD